MSGSGRRRHPVTVAAFGATDLLVEHRQVLHRACSSWEALGPLDRGSLAAARSRRVDVAFLEAGPAADPALWEELAAVVPAVVLVARGPEHAVLAFRLGAADYLLAPVGRDRLLQALGRAADRVARRPAPPEEPAYPERLAVRRGRTLHLLRTEEVRWVGSAGNYVELWTDAGSYRLRATLTELEERLDPRRFLRIHRRHIVQIDSVRSLLHLGSGEYELTLRDGTSLKLTRKYRRSLDILCDPDARFA